MLLFITFLSISKLLIVQVLRISLSLCFSVCAFIETVCLKLHSVFLHPNHYFKCSSEGFQLLLVTIHRYCYKMSISLGLSVFTLQLHIPSFHSNTFSIFLLDSICLSLLRAIRFCFINLTSQIFRELGESFNNIVAYLPDYGNQEQKEAENNSKLEFYQFTSSIVILFFLSGLIVLLLLLICFV